MIHGCDVPPDPAGLSAAKPTRPSPGTDCSILLHNYGHGGVGGSLSWGYATETKKLLADR
jgi:hypothetical protein